MSGDMAAALKAAIASANGYHDIIIRHCLETTVMRVHLSTVHPTMTSRRCGRPCRRSSLRAVAADNVFHAILVKLTNDKELGKFEVRVRQVRKAEAVCLHSIGKAEADLLAE